MRDSKGRFMAAYNPRRRFRTPAPTPAPLDAEEQLLEGVMHDTYRAFWRWHDDAEASLGRLPEVMLIGDRLLPRELGGSPESASLYSTWWDAFLSLVALLDLTAEPQLS